jgi:hypothetical protein
MFGNLSIGGKGWGMRGLAAALLLMGATFAGADEAERDSVLDGWLGGEFTVQSSTLNDHMPVGGKLTFIFDSADNVVRICTRSVAAQRGPWRMDFANPCGVTMTFTRGTRFCTFEDVKAGNAEVLSACHRLRSRDVAMRPAKVKGTIELNDMIAFLVQGTDGKKYMSILVDSPSRVTDEGTVIIGGQK